MFKSFGAVCDVNGYGGVHQINLCFKAEGIICYPHYTKKERHPTATSHYWLWCLPRVLLQNRNHNFGFFHGRFSRMCARNVGWSLYWLYSVWGSLPNESKQSKMWNPCTILPVFLIETLDPETSDSLVSPCTWKQDLACLVQKVACALADVLSRWS